MSKVVEFETKKEKKGKLTAEKSMEVVWRLQQIDHRNAKIIDGGTPSIEEMKKIKNFLLTYMPYIKHIKGKEGYVSSMQEKAAHIVEYITSKSNGYVFNFEKGDVYSFETLAEEMSMLEDVLIEGVSNFAVEVVRIKKDLKENKFEQKDIEGKLREYEKKSGIITNFYKISFETKCTLGY